jgi:hypothetical protein
LGLGIVLVFLKGLTAKVTARAPEWIEVVGLGTVAFGVGMIFLPAGVIVAGMSLCFVGYSVGGDR